MYNTRERANVSTQTSISSWVEVYTRTHTNKSLFTNDRRQHERSPLRHSFRCQTLTAPSQAKRMVNKNIHCAERSCERNWLIWSFSEWLRQHDWGKFGCESVSELVPRVHTAEATAERFIHNVHGELFAGRNACILHATNSQHCRWIICIDLHRMHGQSHCCIRISDSVRCQRDKSSTIPHRKHSKNLRRKQWPTNIGGYWLWWKCIERNKR